MMEEKMKFLGKSGLKPLVILIFLAVTLPLAAWLVSQEQNLQKRASCSVNLKLTPASGSYAKNTPFPVKLQIVAGTAAVEGANIGLTFDKTKLKINSIAFSSAINNEVVKTFDNTVGTAQIGAVKLSAGGVTGTIDFATIAFQGIATGTGAVVSIGGAEIAAGDCTVGTKTGGAYTITSAPGPTNTPRPPTPTPTGSIAPTPTPTGGAGEAIKIKFNMRGVNTQPAIVANRTLPFKVSVFTNPRNTNWFFEPTGTVNENGLWTVTIQAPAFKLLDFPFKYDIFIKGPMHLKKRFSMPPVTNDGQDQYVNLPAMGPERYALEPGDLPISGAGNVQDGVVNSLDAVYLTGCFETPDDATCLAKADLNLDGIISTMDMELMNGTVYSKWEDEVE